MNIDNIGHDRYIERIGSAATRMHVAEDARLIAEFCKTYDLNVHTVMELLLSQRRLRKKGDESAP